MLAQKENTDNHRDYQRSSLNKFGDPRPSKGELICLRDTFGFLFCF